MKSFLFLPTQIFLLPMFFLFGCAAPEKTNESLVFYPSLPSKPRIQYLLTISSEDDIRDSEGALIDFLVGDISSEKTIQKPYDISSTPGKIYILDRGYKKLLIIDLETRQFNHLDDQKMGKLMEPSGIWVSPDGTKYITDMQRKQVVVFDAENNYLMTYGSRDIFDKPVDVAVDEKRIYVCDMNKNEILVLNKKNGRLQKKISSLGNEKDHLYKPSHITLDQSSNIYVNDAFNYKIQKFDHQGNFIKSFGFHGDVVGAFARPKGLALDRKGRLYAVDAAYENTQIFDTESGKLLLFFGGGGTAPGNMYLPASIHIDYSNAQYYKNYADKDFKIEYVVYVGNMFGPNKLSVYGFGQWTGPYLPDGANETHGHKNSKELK